MKFKIEGLNPTFVVEIGIVFAYNRVMKKIKRTIYIILGSLCVVFGVVGVFVPVLPTTPFLLLAAWFFTHSSDRFYQWLITNRWFGSYIRNYREGRGIPLGQKVISISLLWLTIGSSVIFIIDQWWLRGLLLFIAVGVSYHLITIRTYRIEKSSEGDPAIECCVEEN